MYSVRIRSKSGFDYYDILDTFDEAFEIALSARNYFDEHRPGQLLECRVTEVCDTTLHEPFVHDLCNSLEENPSRMYGVIIKNNSGLFIRNVFHSYMAAASMCRNYVQSYSVFHPGELTDCYVFELDDPSDLDECIHTVIIKDFLQGE